VSCMIQAIQRFLRALLHVSRKMLDQMCKSNER
jgi:hypothetical protein